MYLLQIMSAPAPRFFECFTDQPGGGNPVAIVSGAAFGSAQAMQDLAREIGAPATCFIDQITDTSVHARFFSPRSQYTMCGHAVIGLFTMLLQDQTIDARPQFTLTTPAGSAPVYVEMRAQNRPRIMLDLPIPRFQAPGLLPTEISGVLKIPVEALSDRIPVQIAQADFIHLLVPLKSHDDLTGLVPDFPQIEKFCRSASLESIAVFSPPDGTAKNIYQVREFCPAIGVDESAAGGTTNASLSAYLAAQGELVPTAAQLAKAQAHQGASIGRPSVINTEVRFDGATVASVRAGGTAVEMNKV